MKTVNVTAEWTGTDEVQRGSSTYVSTSGEFRFKSVSNSNSRKATTTWSVNNNDLGQTDNNGNLYNLSLHIYKWKNKKR